MKTFQWNFIMYTYNVGLFSSLAPIYDSKQLIIWIPITLWGLTCLMQFARNSLRMWYCTPSACDHLHALLHHFFSMPNAGSVTSFQCLIPSLFWPWHDMLHRWSSGPPRKFAGPGAKLYLGLPWCHYFQTRLKTCGQYSKALRISLNGAF